jgi:hypothetical protein
VQMSWGHPFCPCSTAPPFRCPPCVAVQLGRPDSTARFPCCRRPAAGCLWPALLPAAVLRRLTGWGVGAGVGVAGRGGAAAAGARAGAGGGSPHFAAHWVQDADAHGDHAGALSAPPRPPRPRPPRPGRPRGHRRPLLGQLPPGPPRPQGPLLAYLGPSLPPWRQMPRIACCCFLACCPLLVSVLPLLCPPLLPCPWLTAGPPNCR